LLIIYSPPCLPRCPCLSFFSRKEIKVFDETIPGFFLHIMHFTEKQTVQCPKDSFSAFILMNEFEQESHKHASQNRARRAFELIKLKLCYLFIKWVIVLLDKTLIHHLESLKAIWTVSSLHWKCLLDLEPFGSHWSAWYGKKILECFHQKP